MREAEETIDSAAARLVVERSGANVNTKAKREREEMVDPQMPTSYEARRGGIYTQVRGSRDKYAACKVRKGENERKGKNV